MGWERKEEVLMGEAGKETPSWIRAAKIKGEGVILTSGEERLGENARVGKGEKEMKCGRWSPL